ncbi:MAG: hypothetical protein K8963_10330 [Proteobacteria bacterium]|nr:hypothetical protein [Pseudomonadota bacterium]
MKEENKVFREEMRVENKVFREETKAENRVFREETKAENNVFRKEMRAEMVASRKEYDDKMVALRKEFKEDMAAFQTLVGDQLKDLKQWTQWMISITVLLLTAVNFLPLLLAPTENPGVVQVERAGNQHPQTKKELTQVQGQLTQVEGQLTQVQDQLTQVIEYLQADARPGQATPVLPTTKPGAEQDAR